MGDGGICTSSHFLPGEWVRMVELCRDGKLAEARDLHYRLLPLAKAMFCEPNPAPLKAALKLVGHDCGAPRLPMTLAGEPCVAMLRKVLGELGLI